MSKNVCKFIALADPHIDFIPPDDHLQRRQGLGTLVLNPQSMSVIYPVHPIANSQPYHLHMKISLIVPIFAALCSAPLSIGQSTSYNFTSEDTYTENFTNTGAIPEFNQTGGLNGTGALDYSSIYYGTNSYGIASQLPIPLLGQTILTVRFKYNFGIAGRLHLGVFHEYTPDVPGPSFSDPSSYVTIGVNNSIQLSSGISYDNSASFEDTRFSGDWYTLRFDISTEGINQFSVNGSLFGGGDTSFINPLAEVNYTSFNVQYSGYDFVYPFFRIENGQEILMEIDQFTVTAVPEPATVTLWLGSIGLAVVILRRGRSSKRGQQRSFRRA